MILKIEKICTELFCRALRFTELYGSCPCRHLFISVPGVSEEPQHRERVPWPPRPWDRKSLTLALGEDLKVGLTLFNYCTSFFL